MIRLIGSIGFGLLNFVIGILIGMIIESFIEE